MARQSVDIEERYKVLILDKSFKWQEIPEQIVTESPASLDAVWQKLLEPLRQHYWRREGDTLWLVPAEVLQTAALSGEFRSQLSFSISCMVARLFLLARN
jgi:hypothetical protein